MQPSVPPPLGLRRPVSVKMKPNWTFNAKDGRFHGPKGETFSPEDLPPGTRIEPVVPQLAKQAPDKLSSAERDLQTYVHVVLPAGHDPERHTAAIRKWPCVDTAVAGPAVSLPGPGVSPKPPR